MYGTGMHKILLKIFYNTGTPGQEKSYLRKSDLYTWIIWNIPGCAGLIFFYNFKTQKRCDATIQGLRAAQKKTRPIFRSGRIVPKNKYSD